MNFIKKLFKKDENTSNKSIEKQIEIKEGIRFDVREIIETALFKKNEN